ncbi:MAG TPA: recombinase family protein [Acidimicrobiales bacterium]|nr:recombinase family protein [Acidimicrobiales bacterium]
MSTSVVYVRVSTEDQVEFSPDAQAKRCRDLAQLKGLGPVTVLADEGWSGKNLDRPAVRELLSLVEAGAVSNLVIWRWDRLSRDQGDFATLVKLFDRHHVKVHSVNEGELDLASASGRMQIGVHGVFAQYYRDQLIENTRMGQRQAAEQGRWLNRAPTGYNMINGALVPNEMAPLVQRAFTLRAAGSSYPAIESEIGVKFSTVRHMCLNRVYVGEVTLGGEWFTGLHEPLVSLELFAAAQRAHTTGKRRSRDLLSGFVRCGLCDRVAGVHYNECGQAIYRCRHRGQGCHQSGRSAHGLHRAAVLGLRVLSSDVDLQLAIRDQLSAHRGPQTHRGPSVASVVASLKTKERKLLDLYYADQINAETFAEESRRLSTQIATLQDEMADTERERQTRDHLATRFDHVADLLANIDFDQLWQCADPKERRTLVEDLIDAVRIYPDKLTVQIVGAPPIIVALDEVGLRGGIKTVVSEAGLEPARP